MTSTTLNIKPLGKTTGTSAVAAAAYRSASCLTRIITDPETNISAKQSFDYSKKQGLVWSEIIAPEGIDKKFLDREFLWNSVEKNETHVKAVYAKDFKIGLQNELSIEQSKELIREFITENITSLGLIADVNFHFDDELNPHAHIMITTRQLVYNYIEEAWEWAKNKKREIDKPKWLLVIREKYENTVNKYFRMYGISEEISMKSYKRLGIDFLTPTIHEGTSVHVKDICERIEQNKQIVAENIRILQEHPEFVLRQMMKRKSSFSKDQILNDIKSLIQKVSVRNCVNSDEEERQLKTRMFRLYEIECKKLLTQSRDLELASVEEKNKILLQSGNDEEVVRICQKDINGKEIFASVLQLKSEKELLENIQALRSRSDHKIQVEERDVIQYQKQVKQANFANDNEIQEQIKEDLLRIMKSKTVFSRDDFGYDLNMLAEEIVLKSLGIAENKDRYQDGYQDRYQGTELEAIKQDMKLEILAKSKSILNSLFDEAANFEKMNFKERHAFLCDDDTEALVKICQQDINGLEVFALKNQLKLEEEFIGNIRILKSRFGHSLQFNEQFEGEEKKQKTNILSFMKYAVEKQEQGIIMNEEQARAVKEILSGSDISVLIGRAGTGKSTTLRPIVDSLKAKGYNVYGAAQSAIATLNLEKEIGGKCYTLDKWKYHWEKQDEVVAVGEGGRYKLPILSQNDVFIIDEISIVDVQTFNYFAKTIVDAGAKLICAGDDNQFSSIKYAPAVHKILQEVPASVLSEVFRQRNKLDRKVSEHISHFQLIEALTYLDEGKKITIRDSSAKLIEEISEEYISKIKENDVNQVAVICYTNKNIHAINQRVRQKMIDRGMLFTNSYDGYEFNTSEGKRQIVVGERIVFTKNSWFGVKNGHLGEVLEILDNNLLKVRVFINKNETKELYIDTNKYNHFDYGYAITAYKSQGETYDYTLVMIDSNDGFESFNVMATRHRDGCQFFVSEELLLQEIKKYEQFGTVDIRNKKNIIAILSHITARREIQKLASDYANYNEIPEIINIKSYLESKEEIREIRIKLEGRTLYRNLSKQEREKLKIDVMNARIKLKNLAVLKGSSEYIKASNEARLVASKIRNYKKATYKTRSEYSVNESKIELLRGLYKAELVKRDAANAIISNWSLHQKYAPVRIMSLNTIRKDAGHGIANKVKIEFTGNKSDYIQAEALENAIKHVRKYYNSCIKSHTVHSENELIRNTLHTLELNDLTKNEIRSLEKDLIEAKNNFWKLEAEEIAIEKEPKDLEEYIAQCFKEGPKVIIDRWKALKQKYTNPKEILDKNPAILGELKGKTFLGFAFDYESRVINYKSKTLGQRFEKLDSIDLRHESLSYDLIEAKNEISKIELQIDVLGKPLHKENLVLLNKIIENRDNLKDWFKNESERVKEYKFKLTRKNLVTKDKLEAQQDTKLESQNSLEAKHDIEHYNIIKTKSKVLLNKHKQASDSLKADRIHDKLTDHVDEIAGEMLRLISNKPIELTAQSIKCGSIDVMRCGPRKGQWYRFSRAEGGNLFHLIAEAKNIQLPEAIEWAKDYIGESKKSKNLSQGTNRSVIKDAELKIRDIEDEKLIMPVPSSASALNAKSLLYRHLRGKNKYLSGTYEYRNIKNELCGYVVRITDRNTGDKITLPVTYHEGQSGVRGWKIKGFGEERPLYNEHLLEKNQAKAVLIVEGEKTADAALEKYPEFTVISWSGGANSYKKSNWDLLEGREVVIWPDNDEPGVKAAEGIVQILEGKAKSVRIVNLKGLSLPESWDLADELPAGTEKHTITSMLFEKVGFDQDKKARIINEYSAYRIKVLNEEMQKKKYNFAEFIEAKMENAELLKLEKNIMQEKLSNNQIITEVLEINVGIEARSMLSHDFYMLDNVKNIEDIENFVQKRLEKKYNNLRKDHMEHIVKEAVNFSVEFAKQHLDKVNVHNNSQIVKISHFVADEIITDISTKNIDLGSISLKDSIHHVGQKLQEIENHFEHQMQMQNQMQKHKELQMGD